MKTGPRTPAWLGCHGVILLGTRNIRDDYNHQNDIKF